MTATAQKPLKGVALRRYLDSLTVLKGGHTPDSKFCVMEAVAYVAGEPWSDQPECASKVIGAFMRTWNDSMNDGDRQMLKPYIPKLVGTAGTDEQEKARSWMALDWYCRVSAPAWLRAAKLDAEADAIEATAPIIDSASAKAAQASLKAASAARAAARAAARDAAGAAARAAARDAAGAAARAALRPTVVALQKSALELLDRMIAVTA